MAELARASAWAARTVAEWAWLTGQPSRPAPLAEDEFPIVLKISSSAITARPTSIEGDHVAHRCRFLAALERGPADDAGALVRVRRLTASGHGLGRIQSDAVTSSRPAISSVTEQRVLPYGSWPSPITIDLAIEANLSIHSPQLDGDCVYWTEVGRLKAGGRSSSAATHRVR